MNLLREQCNDRLTFPTSFHLWRRHTGCGAGHVGSVGVRWQPLLHAEVLLQDRYGVRNGSKAIPLFVHTIRPLRKTLSFVGCEVENRSSSRDQANSCFLLILQRSSSPEPQGGRWFGNNAIDWPVHMQLLICRGNGAGTATFRRSDDRISNRRPSGT